MCSLFPKMSDSSSWFLSYPTKLRFFSQIQRFLQIKSSRKCYGPSDQHNKERFIEEETEMKNQRDENLFLMQKSVKQIHFGSLEEKEIAAKEIKRLAREDLKVRRTLASLGVISSLVSMLDSKNSDHRRLAVQALIELANGSFTNKALMVEAGILSKFPINVDTMEEPIRHDFALLLLSLSSLANNTQLSIVPSEILSFLIGILDSNASFESKTTCLGALYNLSAMLDNVGPLVSNGVIHILLRLLFEKETSEKALGTLGNLVVSVMGKKAMENDPTMPEILIEIMTWEAKPKCQELSAYILMILAHQSSAQREKMKQLGIVPILLEVALLGSPLARKRVLKLLQWFKNEKQIKIRSHSGPQTGIAAMGSPVNEMEINKGKKIIKMMVKQSLNKNMELITRRANSAGDSSDSSKIKALVISSRSKSFPY